MGNTQYGHFQELIGTFGNGRTELQNIGRNYSEKIIRDKVGIKISEREPRSIRIISDTQEKVRFLMNKIFEELREFTEASMNQGLGDKKTKIYEESGDVLEVLDSIITLEPENVFIKKWREDFISYLISLQYDITTILQIQAAKRESHGSFNEGYLLKL